MLGVCWAQRFTLKGFRAGKASALAAAGKSIGVILAAGEWRSKAFLRYIDEEILDAGQLLQIVADASDEECV